MATAPAETVVRVPEPELTPAEVVARAQRLRPLLREQQAETEERSYHSEQLHREFLQAGFYRLLQPRRYGGYEFDLGTFYRVIMEVARGCPSTGWCLCLASGHALNVGALLPERAQAEIFGPDGDFRAASRGTPNGSVTAVPSGWQVDGTWDYCSGAPYSNWFVTVVGMPGTRPDGAPVLGYAAIPRSQWTMLDDWRSVLGLRGSGSHSIRVEQAMIPAHHVVDTWLIDVVPFEQTPGYELHGNPMYAGRTLGFFHTELAAVMVGLAWAALDEFEHIMRTRKTYMPPLVARYEHVDFQRPFGLALGAAAGAEAIIERVAQLYHEYCRRAADGGRPFTVEDDMRLYVMAQQAGRLAWEAVETLVQSAGSSAAKDGQRMQRYWRDASMYRSHFSSQWQNTAARMAATHFGLPPR